MELNEQIIDDNNAPPYVMEVEIPDVMELPCDAFQNYFSKEESKITMCSNTTKDFLLNVFEMYSSKCGITEFLKMVVKFIKTKITVPSHEGECVTLKTVSQLEKMTEDLKKSSEEEIVINENLKIFLNNCPTCCESCIIKQENSSQSTEHKEAIYKQEKQETNKLNPDKTEAGNDTLIQEECVEVKVKNHKDFGEQAAKKHNQEITKQDLIERPKIEKNLDNNNNTNQTRKQKHYREDSKNRRGIEELTIPTAINDKQISENTETKSYKAHYKCASKFKNETKQDVIILTKIKKDSNKDDNQKINERKVKETHKTEKRREKEDSIKVEDVNIQRIKKPYDEDMVNKESGNIVENKYQKSNEKLIIPAINDKQFFEREDQKIIERKVKETHKTEKRREKEDSIKVEDVNIQKIKKPYDEDNKESGNIVENKYQKNNEKLIIPAINDKQFFDREEKNKKSKYFDKPAKHDKDCTKNKIKNETKHDTSVNKIYKRPKKYHKELKPECYKQLFKKHYHKEPEPEGRKKTSGNKHEEPEPKKKIYEKEPTRKCIPQESLHISSVGAASEKLFALSLSEDHQNTSVIKKQDYEEPEIKTKPTIKCTPQESLHITEDGAASEKLFALSLSEDRQNTSVIKKQDYEEPELKKNSKIKCTPQKSLHIPAGEEASEKLFAVSLSEDRQTTSVIKKQDYEDPELKKNSKIKCTPQESLQVTAAGVASEKLFAVPLSEDRQNTSVIKKQDYEEPELKKNSKIKCTPQKSLHIPADGEASKKLFALSLSEDRQNNSVIKKQDYEEPELKNKSTIKCTPQESLQITPAGEASEKLFAVSLGEDRQNTSVIKKQDYEEPKLKKKSAIKRTPKESSHINPAGEASEKLFALSLIEDHQHTSVIKKIGNPISVDLPKESVDQNCFTPFTYPYSLENDFGRITMDENHHRKSSLYPMKRNRFAKKTDETKSKSVHLGEDQAFVFDENALKANYEKAGGGKFLTHNNESVRFGGDQPFIIHEDAPLANKETRYEGGGNYANEAVQNAKSVHFGNDETFLFKADDPVANFGGTGYGDQFQSNDQFLLKNPRMSTSAKRNVKGILKTKSGISSLPVNYNAPYVRNMKEPSLQISNDGQFTGDIGPRFWPLSDQLTGHPVSYNHHVPLSIPSAYSLSNFTNPLDRNCTVTSNYAVDGSGLISYPNAPSCSAVGNNLYHGQNYPIDLARNNIKINDGPTSSRLYDQFSGAMLPAKLDTPSCSNVTNQANYPVSITKTKAKRPTRKRRQKSTKQTGSELARLAEEVAVPSRVPNPAEYLWNIPKPVVLDYSKATLGNENLSVFGNAGTCRQDCLLPETSYNLKVAEELIGSLSAHNPTESIASTSSDVTTYSKLRNNEDESQLPFKKRRTVLQVEEAEVTTKTEESYPAMQMMCIAEVLDEQQKYALSRQT